MKTPKDAFGRPETLREGPHTCKGSSCQSISQPMTYTPEQVVWMKENKPLYYTGQLKLDIHHLPVELRSL